MSGQYRPDRAGKKATRTGLGALSRRLSDRRPGRDDPFRARVGDLRCRGKLARIAPPAVRLPASPGSPEGPTAKLAPVRLPPSVSGRFTGHTFVIGPSSQFEDLRRLLHSRPAFGIALPLPASDRRHLGCGCSSVVEHDLAKVGVEGSSPFARSKISLTGKVTSVSTTGRRQGGFGSRFCRCRADPSRRLASFSYSARHAMPVHQRLQSHPRTGEAIP